MNWKDVEEFKNWWIIKKPWRPPFKDAMYFTEMVVSLVIYRHGNFQIELNIGRPNTEAPYHKHPNVDSLFMYLTGDFYFGVDNIIRERMKENQIANPKIPDVHILLGVCENIGGASHNLVIREHGCSYLSFEHWKNGITPTGVTANWDGETVGTEHNNTIKGYK